jgi:hypothetical protein
MVLKLSATPTPDMLLVWGEVGRDPYTLPARELRVTICKYGNISTIGHDGMQSAGARSARKQRVTICSLLS